MNLTEELKVNSNVKVIFFIKLKVNLTVKLKVNLIDSKFEC